MAEMQSWQTPIVEDCFMVGRRDPKSILQCNTYLRTFRGKGSPVHWCIDPGSRIDYADVRAHRWGARAVEDVAAADEQIEVLRVRGGAKQTRRHHGGALDQHANIHSAPSITSLQLPSTDRKFDRTTQYKALTGEPFAGIQAHVLFLFIERLQVFHAVDDGAPAGAADAFGASERHAKGLGRLKHARAIRQFALVTFESDLRHPESPLLSARLA